VSVIKGAVGAVATSAVDVCTVLPTAPCGQRFSRSDGKGAAATGAVAAALVLSNLLQRTFGRGVRLERVAIVKD
jgi:hypothetical protein